jgi:hypothetical protein
LRFSGLDLALLLTNSAAHPRRRAMRVMVEMMVPDQHEKLDYPSMAGRVKVENLIRRIEKAKTRQESALSQTTSTGIYMRIASL